MNLPKHAELWLPSYLSNRARHLAARPKPRRLYVAFTDHFEPHGNTTLDVAHLRLATWQNRWPRIAADAPRDSAGKPPCFTFFYPQEEYQRDLLNIIAGLTHDGTADVEVHLHHFDDTAPSFVEKMQTFIRTLHEHHGLLHPLNGRLAFAFIHGNWALDNSRPDGLKCGVTGELQLLRDLGCYADFTMPSFPSPTQSRIVNQIYWTTGSPTRPRGFDSGIEATPAGGRQGDLLMVTGPLGLRFRDRLMPRFETGELAFYDPPTPARIERWLALAPAHRRLHLPQALRPQRPRGQRRRAPRHRPRQPRHPRPHVPLDPPGRPAAPPRAPLDQRLRACTAPSNPSSRSRRSPPPPSPWNSAQ